MKPIIGILGPTAVGKSSLALRLAKEINTEIISADSMQIYKGFDIGTAKPTPEEMGLVRHHLIDIAEPNDNFSSYLFKEATDKVLEDFAERNLVPLIVGGTGFFFKNLLFEFDFEEGRDFLSIREKLRRDYEEFGSGYIHSLLEKIDPDSAKIIHPNDVKKAIRAIEIYYSTGKRKSEGKNAQMLRYQNILFVLYRDSKKLYDDINRRVDKMVEDGLFEEVEKLSKVFRQDCAAFNGIGYKEIIRFINGEYDKNTAIELVKQHSRNYAKRQITFYKKMDAIWHNADEHSTAELIDIIKTVYFDRFNIKI